MLDKKTLDEKTIGRKDVGRKDVDEKMLDEKTWTKRRGRRSVERKDAPPTIMYHDTHYMTTSVGDITIA